MNYFSLALDLPSYQRRRRAFHEAGHLWAAYQTGASIGSGTLDSPAPLDVWDEDLWGWIAVAGYLVETLSMSMDLHVAAGGDPGTVLTDTMPRFGLLVLRQPTQCSHDPRACLEKTVLHRDHVRAQLRLVLADWFGIDSLAQALVGKTVSHEVVAKHLTPDGFSKRLEERDGDAA